MSREVDAFLQDLLDAGADAEVLGDLANLVAPARPPQSLRDRVLAGLGGRLHHFADDVAALFDTSLESARDLLDGIDDAANWTPGPGKGVTLYLIGGGPRVAGSITGFVRVARGGTFPEHDHLGHEDVLILQGRCRDSATGRTLGPGDRAPQEPGTSHHVEVLPGPALVFLTVVHTGVDIGGRILGPSRP